MKHDLWRVALALALGGGVLLWKAWTRYGAMRRVQDTPRSRAASAPQGRVELQGIAWPEDGAALVTPGGTEVVYYDLELQREQRRGRKRRTQWVTVATRRHAPDFLLVDATGVVRVSAGEAGLDVAARRRTRSWSSVAAAERERIVAYLARPVAGFPPSGSLFGLFSSRFRLRESEIAVGSPLYANGDLRTTAVGETVRARGLTAFHAQLFGGDNRSAGASAHVEDPAGSLARELAMAAATAARKAATDAEVEFRVAGRLGCSDDNPLYVADRHEEHLGREWRTSVHLPAAGGVAAICAAAWLFLATSQPPSAHPVPHGSPASASGRPLTADRTAHETLRVRCIGGSADACDELLQRARDLGIREDIRRDYARRACELGLARHCAGA